MFVRTKLILVISLLIAIIALFAGVANQPSRLEPKIAPGGSVSYPTSVGGLLAECGDIFTFDVPKQNAGVIPDDYMAPIPVLRVSVPVYGYMTSDSFGDKNRIYERNYEGFSYPQALRILWEGNQIIWYSTDIDKTTYDFLANYVETANKSNGNKLVLAPWKFEDDGNRTIPSSRSFAFSSWGASQSCESFDEKVFTDFQKKAAEYNYVRDYNNPPLAEVQKNNLLPQFFN